jgi:excisionase family DNA binding protein
VSNKLLTTKEITEELKCHRASLYRWREEGMPHIKLGGSVRYDLDEVMEWFKERQAKSLNGK